ATRLALREDDVVETDVIDVERDVLLGLPPDLLREILRGHRRHLDLLDDDGVTGQRGGETRGLDPGRGDQPVQGIDHERGVHDRAVDDRLRRQGLDPQALEPILALLLVELGQFERRTAEIESNQTLRAREQHDAIYPLSSELADRTSY